jgi:hypothetical protein
MELQRPAKDGRYDTAGVLRTQLCLSAPRLFPRTGERAHPLWDLHWPRIGRLSARLGNIGRFNDSLGLNISQLIMDRASEVDRFLAERDPATPISKMPLENRETDTGKAMQFPLRIDDELERNIVRGAAVRMVNLCANGCTICR